MLTHPSKKALHEIQEYPELTALAPGFPATDRGSPHSGGRPRECAQRLSQDSAAASLSALVP